MKKIRDFEAALFLLAFVPVSKMFYLPSLYAKNASQDMWISAAINVLIEALTLFAVLSLWRKKGDKKLFDILSKKVGKNGAKCIFVLYAVYFFIKAYLPFAEQKNFIEATLYENNANALTFMPVFILCGYLAVKKTVVLGRLGDIFAFITLTGLTVIIAFSLDDCDFASVLPVGLSGAGSIIKGSLSALTWFGDGVYFLFIMHEVTKDKKPVLKISLSYILAGIFIVVFSYLFYCSFTYAAARQNYALIDISKFSSVIYNVERFDYIGIFCILLSGIISLCLPVYFCVYALSEVFGESKKTYISVLVCIILAAAVYFTKESFLTLLSVITNYLSPVLLLFSNILPFIIALIVRRKDEKTF